MSAYIPAELERLLDRFTDGSAPIRTQVMRAREHMARSSTPAGRVDPDTFQQTAESDSAPAELAALTEAVRSGRTTWEQLASGAVGHLPEVKAFHTAALDGLRERLTDSGADEMAPPDDDEDLQWPLRRDGW